MSAHVADAGPVWAAWASAWAPGGWLAAFVWVVGHTATGSLTEAGMQARAEQRRQQTLDASLDALVL